MKLSTKTIALLKNFAEINENLFIQEGERIIRTISPIGNIFAVGRLKEDEIFPIDVPIYQLREFLSVLGLVKDFSLEFESEDSLLVKNSNSTVRYRLASKDIITYPENDVVMPEVDFSFNLSTDIIGKIRSACSILGEETISFSHGPDNQTVRLLVTSLEDPTSNSFELYIPVSEGEIPPDQNYIIHSGNLKIIPQQYTVSFSKEGLARFVSDDVEYYIPLEEER